VAAFCDGVAGAHRVKSRPNIAAGITREIAQASRGIVINGTRYWLQHRSIRATESYRRHGGEIASSGLPGQHMLCEIVVKITQADDSGWQRVTQRVWLENNELYIGSTLGPSKLKYQLAIINC